MKLLKNSITSYSNQELMSELSSRNINDPSDFGTDEILSKFLIEKLPEVYHIKISSRTKEGLYRARIKGCYTSKAPLGYKNYRIGYDSTLAFNEHSKTIKQAFKLFAEGKYSFSEIRNFLNENGINKSFSELRKILTNRVYLGEIHVPAFKEHKEKYVQGLHEPLISKDVFEKANKLILLQNN